MEIMAIDHLVLTVRDLDATCAFYIQLGMQLTTFGNNRKALHFGQQKINLQQASREIEPHAFSPTPGSADLCLITSTPLAEVKAHLQACNIPTEQGIVPRTGANGAIDSLYIRDPDRNLLELSNYRSPDR